MLLTAIALSIKERQFLTETWRIMRIISFLLLVCCLQVSATGTSQEITFSGENVSLQKIFAVIEKQTGFVVAFDNKQLKEAKTVTVKVNKESLSQFLDKVLNGQNLIYVIRENTIFIRKKETTPDLSQGLGKTTLVVDLPPITGVIRDGDGNPIAGANIVIKGTKKGVITDAYGNFRIDAKEGEVLIISSINYGTKELRIVALNVPLVVALEKSVSQLDEVQIIAYGTTSKRFSTGNVSTVTAKDIEKQPVSNPLIALSGRVPGLFIAQTSGLNGGGVTALIQGRNSIASGNDPFYVVDGVPYPQQLIEGLGNIMSYSGVTRPARGNPLNYINPNDIESISVLKGADATAIYGSRAANGAILITTKKGMTGDTKLMVNAQQGWGQVMRTVDLLNTQQYVMMRTENYTNDGIPVEDGSLNFDLVLYDTTKYTDWIKKLIGGTAAYTNINATLSGGTNTLQYNLGVAYRKQSSVFPGNLDNRSSSIQFNLNNVSKNERFSLRFSGSYLQDNNQLPLRDLTQTAFELSPNAPDLYDADGNLNWALDSNGVTSWYLTNANPLADLLQQYSRKNINLIGSSVISYKIAKNLELKSNFGYNRLQADEMTLGPMAAIPPQDRPFLIRNAAYGHNSSNTWIIEPQLSYSVNIARGKLDALIGTTFQDVDLNGYSIGASGFSSDDVLEDMSSAQSLDRLGTTIAERKYQAVFGRVGYNWDNKYLVNITARRDGSSSFGPANRFHSFGAVGAGWIFTQEDFIKNSFPFLSFGKLRSSYGTTGNDQIGDYQYLNRYNNVFTFVPYLGVQGIAPSGIPNPYLQWEETKKLEFGLDLGFNNDRINLSANYFRNRCSNQLIGYQLPDMTGANQVLTNFPATVQNSGWEFSLTSNNIKDKDFSWTTSFNITLPKNKLISFPNLANSTYANILVIGEPVSLLKLFRSAGVNAQTGFYQFYTSDGHITATPEYVKDQTVYKNPDARLYGGLQNTFQFKSIEIDFIFQFVKQIAPTYKLGNYPGSSPRNQPTYVLDRWQTPGDENPVQKFTSDPIIYEIGFALSESDVYYEDASYARLKNLSITWRMPASWVKSIHFKGVNVFAQGQNLLTITKYSGLDPESQGLVRSNILPPLRMVTAGIRFEL